MPDLVSPPKRKVMNISSGMQSVNLDTMKNGKRESAHLRPREVVELSDEQFRSAELQKLVRARFVVDVTAAEERRVRREGEMGLRK